ncbi:hypothetical protein SASPL_136840 [Salvia splendens]|uniref:Leucine-rich repeat-containing N-terminal plant-type domain-containing protein n=1 Tax=Salvia splendens TaxID=180675 RepID=A0A8X8X0M2_SALSN|nr:hypothetical protein SASPL_136840 [Salvia splendens]
MAISSLLFFVFFIIFVDGQCLDHQKKLLLDLKSELVFNSSISRKLVTWNHTYDCCEWGGVECNGAGRVVNLLLNGEHISGGFGESSALFRLTYLSELRLRWNDFTTSEIPNQFHRLTNLRHLDLSRSGFTGSIPSTIVNITSLVYLDLSRNSLTGSLPSFRLCSKLESIDLRGNFLMGSLSHLDFGSLANLSSLLLDRNSLNGSIPHHLFLLPSLSTLTLSNNQFSGQIEEFPIVNDLIWLDLSNNRISGPLPISFFLFQNISILLLSNNLFNGTFQLQKIQTLSKLTEFSLSHNNLLVDTTNSTSNSDVSPQFVTLHLASCNLYEFPYLVNQPYLKDLDLSNNHIGGDIPGWIWESEKSYLNLSFNLLTGLEKPHYIPSYVSYFLILLANNKLTGVIPTFICNATVLGVVDLSFNNLTGSIPPCIIKKNLVRKVLNLKGNKISGVIPDQFSSECGLHTFDVSNNNLGGKVPKSLANCKDLQVMNVGNNNLEGSFPCMLPLSLRILLLRSNRFYGNLRCSKSWPDLQILDISSNHFSGRLNVLNFSSLRGMMLQSPTHSRLNRSNSDFLSANDYYHNEVILTVKGIEVKLVKIWPDFTSIDLSSNRFEGEISDGIGNLSSLYLLNLSHNAFTGVIPKSFGALTELGSLDLSENKLTGGIPWELTKLTFLSILNVSYNDLTGMIPTGPQFQTYSADMFEGNPGLCGFPLDRSCSSSRGPGSTPSEVKDEETEWEYVFAALGYVVGFGSIAWTLLCCRSFRERYFEKIEEESHLPDKDMVCAMRLDDCAALDFGSLTNLSYLVLDQNSLNGSIPQLLFLLPSLRILSVANNQFSGQIEEFPVVNDLVWLDLSNNRIQGPLPSSLFRFQNISVLWVSDNLFDGTFQLRKIQSLSKLTRLSLSYNNLSVDTDNLSSNSDGFPQFDTLHLASCNLYEFPYLRNQSLRDLDLSNNHIGGDIPSWIWGPEMSYLNLSFNLLTDLQKPDYTPASLSYLDLQSNKLRRVLISPILSSLNLSYSVVLLADNVLTGVIPASICTISPLSVLDLSFNNLTGSIPPCLITKNIVSEVLNLRGNKISGVIPDQFSRECGLQTFDVSNNNLGGEVPKSLVNCNNLEVLNVGNNNLEGSFPCMLPLSLRILVLRSNKFHGDLRCCKSWPDLQILDISSNNFRGRLNVLNFSSLRGMMLQSPTHSRINRSNSDFLSANDYYHNEVILTVKGIEVKLVKIWPDFTSVDLSSNRFEGEISDGIGNLSSLYLLNLSHNAFTGVIPKSFGALTELGSLDLSENKLTGGIPWELTKLTFVSILNVSYNDLTGMIPTGPQFQTYSADMFEGNPGLCGFPLDRSCSSSRGPGSTPSEVKDEETEWEYVFAALGYVVGFGSIAWTLLCCRSFRERYFEKIEEVVDEIFYERGRRRRHERRIRRRREERMNGIRKYHHLAYNEFSGEIEEFPVVNDLREIDLSNNRITGPLPSSFFRFQNISVLSLSENSFDGAFQLRKIQSLSKLKVLDLSYNNLSINTTILTSNSDGFPKFNMLHLASCNIYEFPYLGEQSSLVTLDLSNNHIGGDIPGWIWEAGKDYLNLSFNLLTGLEKPRFVASAAYLDLQSNKLSCSTLLSSILTSPNIRNTGLCGFPLDRSCSSSHGPGSTPSESKNEEIAWEYVFAASMLWDSEALHGHCYVVEG